MGSDTKTLTDDEQLQSFFKDEYEKAEKEAEFESWDAKYRQDYDQAKKDSQFFQEALNIKPRSRVIRENRSSPAIVAFGKKGDHSIFALKQLEKLTVVDSASALRFFKAQKDEKGKEADKQYDEVFKLVRDLLFQKHPLPPIRGRRADALKVIQFIEKGLPRAKDYCRDLTQIIKKYDGINEGDLKSIAQLPLEDKMSSEKFETAFGDLKSIVSQHQIASINERASRLEGEYQTIVLSEDLRL